MKSIPKLLVALTLAAAFSACDTQHPAPGTFDPQAAPDFIFAPEKDRENIHSFLDEWHDDAANAREAYFDKIAEGGIYIGTDKTELWEKDEFQEWSRKYFDEGQGWDFDRIDRNIYFSGDGEIAWFDELLETWMGDCRGSGVLSRSNNSWKVEHYHLSVTVPNDTLQGFIDLVKVFEEREAAAQ